VAICSFSHNSSQFLGWYLYKFLYNNNMSSAMLVIILVIFGDSLICNAKH
jgi:hypothetical protein